MAAKKKAARKERRKARTWCINSPPTERDGLMNCEIITGGRMYSWGRGVVVREVLPRKRGKR